MCTTTTTKLLTHGKKKTVNKIETYSFNWFYIIPQLGVRCFRWSILGPGGVAEIKGRHSPSKHVKMLTLGHLTLLLLLKTIQIFFDRSKVPVNEAQCSYHAYVFYYSSSEILQFLKFLA